VGAAGVLVPDTPAVAAVANPSFEEVDGGGGAANWSVFGGHTNGTHAGIDSATSALTAASASTWTLDDTVAFSGKRSMRLDVASGTTGGYSERLLSSPVSVQPNRTYQLSAFMRVESNSGDMPWVWLVQVDANDRA
jgi:hypothetical protein